MITVVTHWRPFEFFRCDWCTHDCNSCKRPQPVDWSELYNVLKNPPPAPIGEITSRYIAGNYQK